MKNFLKKVGFADQKSNDNEGDDVSVDYVSFDDDAINEVDWNLLRAETTFHEYIDRYEHAIMSAICSVDELIQNSQPQKDSMDDEEYQEVVFQSIQDTMNCNMQ